MLKSILSVGLLCALSTAWNLFTIDWLLARYRPFSCLELCHVSTLVWIRHIQDDASEVILVVSYMNLSHLLILVPSSTPVLQPVCFLFCGIQSGLGYIWMWPALDDLTQLTVSHFHPPAPPECKVLLPWLLRCDIVQIRSFSQMSTKHMFVGMTFHLQSITHTEYPYCYLCYTSHTTVISKVYNNFQQGFFFPEPSSLWLVLIWYWKSMTSVRAKNIMQQYSLHPFSQAMQ